MSLQSSDGVWHVIRFFCKDEPIIKGMKCRMLFPWASIFTDSTHGFGGGGQNDHVRLLENLTRVSNVGLIPWCFLLQELPIKLCRS